MTFKTLRSNFLPRKYPYYLVLLGVAATLCVLWSSSSLAQEPGPEPRLQTQGVLEVGDRIAQDNSLYDTYSFEGSAGETITITLESDAFDTYLLLVSPDNQVIAQNDDISPSNRNSELSLTLPADGQYNVIVNAYDDTGHGPYRLTIVPMDLETASSNANPTMTQRSEADALLQQGMQQYRRGQFTQAIATWQQALGQFQALGDKHRVSDLYNNLGEAYRSLGQYTSALTALQQSLTMSQNLDADADIGATLNNLGLVYLDLGRYDRAANYFDQALVDARRTQNPYGESVALKNLGTVYYKQRDLDAALRVNQQSLALRRELGDRYGEAATLNSLGIIYSALGRFEDAFRLYQEALVIDREVDNRAGISVVLSNIGRLYRQQGKISEALAIYQQSLDIRRDVGDRQGEGTVLNNIGFAHLAGGHYDEAITQFEGAIAIWESLRTQDLSDVDKVALFETHTQSYSGLQQTLVAQGQVEAALTVAERGRTRALVEQLSNRLGDETAEQLAAPDLATVQSIADAQAATLVEYAIVDTGLDDPTLYTWVVQPQGAIQFEAVDLTQLDTSLDELVQFSRTVLGGRGRARIDPQSDPLNTLYEILIQPIESYLPADPEANVIIIPQAELFLVPFPALKNTQGRYLIEQHTLRTAPSIQTLDLTRRLQQSQPTRPLSTLTDSDLLIVGNPTMPSLPPLVGDTPTPLPGLPGAEREARAIAALFNTEVLTGDEATETLIKQRLSSARLIHLATHGLLEYGQLEATGRLEVPGAMVLAADDQEDGLLTAEEIFQLSLDANLVVLSACDTGLGNITGDGVIGLSRSLMTAGAPSVIVSLWAVPDAPTAALMTTFYQQLQQGRSKAKALRQAMLTTLKDYPDPSDWAAFTLMGETDRP